MDDAVGVGGGQRVGDLPGPVQGLAHRDRAARQPLPEGLALEQLGDDVRRPLVDPDVVDRDDVGVVQPAREPGLLLQAAEDARVAGQGLSHHLDGHLALQAAVPGAVDLRHPAGAEHRQHLVGSEPGSRGQPHPSTLTAGPPEALSSVEVDSQGELIPGDPGAGSAERGGADSSVGEPARSPRGSPGVCGCRLGGRGRLVG